MDVLSGIASKLGELLVDATIKQARYLFCFNSIVKELKVKETNLKEAQDDINEKVEKEREIHRAIDIEKDVVKWLADVDKEMADVQNLKEKIDKRKSCLNGWCPNWGCRYWLGRKAAKKTNRLSDLLQDRSNFGTVALPKPLPSYKELPIPRHFNESFEATESAFNQIIEALKKKSTKMVGLHGLGGVGKTSLAKFASNQLREQKIFDEVGIATVSRDPNIINVQRELIKSLGWELKEKDEKDRADRLRLMFSESKSRKILIILDDVWNELDLETVGIPVGDGDNCCKILLTTRLQPVCDRMGCDTWIQLGILKPEEGLALLRKHAGIDVDDSTLIDVSKQVADECKGLPLAIKAVGSALRGRNADEWNVALYKLQNAKLNKIEEDYEIDLEDLVGYGVGLVWHQAESIEKARILLRGVIEGLKAASLLLDTGDDSSVKMHDIVRDVAIWIGSVVEKRFFSKTGIGLAERAVEEGLEQYRGISLVGNKKEELPSGLVCPNLQILRLHNTVYDHKLQVPEHFFEEMKALKVVTIIGGVLSLKSLQFLTKLQVLRLIRCDVSDASFLGKLKRLEILYLQWSPIEIPEELRDELSRLKLLHIDASSISPITIKEKFPQLEEFYGRIKEWEVEGKGSEERYARPTELKSQPYGSVVCLPKDFTFPKLERYVMGTGREVEDEMNYGNWRRSLIIDNNPSEATSLVIFSELYQNLEFLRLRGVVGCKDIVPSIDKRGLNQLTYLSVDNCEDLECIMDASQSPQGKSRDHVTLSRLARLRVRGLPELKWIWKAPAQHAISLQTLTELSVSKCNNLTYIFTLSQARSLVQLRSLEVERCKGLECVVEAKFDHNEGEISVGEGNTMLTLPLLRELGLEKLPKLISFCSKNYYSIWPALEELSLEECPNLTYIFTSSQARSLVPLKSLQVEECERLECIIKAKLDYNEGEISVEDGNTMLTLPLLRELRLGKLPKLISICSENYYSIWPALEELCLKDCPNLTVNSTELEANLQYLEEKLERLDVSNCSHLRNTIRVLLKHGLKKLEELSIDELGMQALEAIIANGQENKLIFPCLKKLKLVHLEELQVLHHEGPKHIFSLQTLTILTVRGCTKLRHLLSSTLARNLLQLEILEISDCLELEQIIDEDEDEDHLQPVCFPKLRAICIFSCPKLKRLFHIGVAPSLQQLNYLHIIFNDELEEVFWHKDGAGVMDYNEIVMNELRDLTLLNLPNLTNFWPVGYQIPFPSAKGVHVDNCPKLRANSEGEDDSENSGAEALQTTGEADASRERDANENASEEKDGSEHK